MRDALSDTVAPGVVLPLRKCEWCHTPAQRGLDLCLPCEKRWTSKLEVPFGGGPRSRVRPRHSPRRGEPLVISRCPHPSWLFSFNRDAKVCAQCGRERTALQALQSRLRKLAVRRRWWRIYFLSPTALLPLRGPA